MAIAKLNPGVSTISTHLLNEILAKDGCSGLFIPGKDGLWQDCRNLSGCFTELSLISNVHLLNLIDMFDMAIMVARVTLPAMVTVQAINVRAVSVTTCSPKRRACGKTRSDLYYFFSLKRFMHNFPESV